MRNQLKSFLTAIGLLFSCLVIGVTGYMSIEGYTFVDALYMSVITISTVGYMEVNELSSLGRLFTAGYIIFNIAVFAYAVSVLTSYLFEGKLKSVFSTYMMDRELNKLKDHVIVCGYGRNGSRACDELHREGRKFVIIDKDPEVEENMPDEIRSWFLHGDATLDSVLNSGGIKRAREIIITTPSDAANVFIALTAREMQPKIVIIARASEIETESKLYRAGADQVLMPDHLGGMFMAQMITKPVVIEFLDMLTGHGKTREKYRLESISYDRLKPQYRNISLRELDMNHLTGATVVAVKDNVKGLIPNPPLDTFIGKDDTIIFLCEEGHTVEVLSIISTD